MVKLIWSPRAVEDLDAACAFIARDSDKYSGCNHNQRVNNISNGTGPILGGMGIQLRKSIEDFDDGTLTNSPARRDGIGSSPTSALRTLTKSPTKQKVTKI